MKVIEFAGMPKAGKTTAINIAESYLKKQKKNVRIIYEGARISPLSKEDRFMYNAWSFHNTANRILEARLNKYDFILIDRGVLDHFAFSRAIEHLCPDYNIDAALDYYSMFANLEDYVFLYMLRPEEAIRREKKHNPFLGSVFNIDFLKKLYSSYQSLYESVRIQKEMVLFDGSKPLDKNTKRLIEILKS